MALGRPIPAVNKNPAAKCHKLTTMQQLPIAKPDDEHDEHDDDEMFVENRDFSLPHLHSTPPLGGPRRNIAMTFGTEKLECCGYSTVKIF